MNHPQQQESWQRSLNVNERFNYLDAEARKHILAEIKFQRKDAKKEAISTQRQRVLNEVREVVEGMRATNTMPKNKEYYQERVDVYNQALDDLLCALKEMEEQWKVEEPYATTE